MRQIFILFAIILIVLNLYGQDQVRKSLSLNEAIEIGLRNNPSIKAAHEYIAASKGRYLSEISLPQPEISYDNQWINSENDIESDGERTVSISQTFEFPTIYYLKGSKLFKERQILDLQHIQAETSLTKQIKTAYYNVIFRQYQVKSAEENLSISKDFIKKAEIKQNLGEGTELEKLTAKIQYSEARNNLETALNELKSANAELGYMLGYEDQSYDSPIALSDSMVFADYLTSVDGIKQDSKFNNNVRIAEIFNEIATIENSLAYSTYFPKFNLAYMKQSRENNNGYYGFSIGFSLPVWFMFEQNGKIQEASANLSISEYELKHTQNLLALKLKNAIADFENNLKQVKLYSFEILPQTEEIYNIANKSYEAGELSYIEYLQAKQTLISSRNNYNNALFNYYQSLFIVEEIIGQNIIK